MIFGCIHCPRTVHAPLPADWESLPFPKRKGVEQPARCPLHRQEHARAFVSLGEMVAQKTSSRTR